MIRFDQSLIHFKCLSQSIKKEHFSSDWLFSSSAAICAQGDQSTFQCRRAHRKCLEDSRWKNRQRLADSILRRTYFDHRWPWLLLNHQELGFHVIQSFRPSFAVQNLRLANAAAYQRSFYLENVYVMWSSENDMILTWIQKRFSKKLLAAIVKIRPCTGTAVRFSVVGIGLLSLLTIVLGVQMSPGDDLLVGLWNLLSLWVHRMRLRILLL